MASSFSVITKYHLNIRYRYAKFQIKFWLRDISQYLVVFLFDTCVAFIKVSLPISIFCTKFSKKLYFTVTADWWEIVVQEYDKKIDRQLITFDNCTSLQPFLYSPTKYE